MALGQLAAKVAHELNNPLDGIMRYLSLAQRKLKTGSTDGLDRYLNDAQFGLQRMAEVLRELLEFSRESLPGSPRCPLNYLLQQALQAVEPIAERHHVALFTAPNPLPDPPVPANLYQVLCNLLKNAVDAMPTGGTVNVIVEIQDGCLHLAVCDTGPGIPIEELPHLFEPFYSRKPVGQGTGLGLAVCKEIIDRLGGTIFARNRVDAPNGCEFLIRLPLSASSEVKP